MWKDPIVEEIRAIRRQLAEEAGNDLHEICRRLREWEDKNPDRVISTITTRGEELTPLPSRSVTIDKK